MWNSALTKLKRISKEPMWRVLNRQKQEKRFLTLIYTFRVQVTDLISI